MDVQRIKPSQYWDFEIKKALNKASLVVIFVSVNSVDRRGYVQKEMKLALEKIEEKLVDDIYAIPVRLDDEICFPEQLKGLHFTLASNSECMEQIEDAIRYQLARLGAQQQQIQEQSSVSWSSRVYREEWNGAPGYEFVYNLLNFSSHLYQAISEITTVLHGVMAGHAMEQRLVMLEEPDPDCNFGQDKWRRINSYEARCVDPIITGKVMSLIYELYTNRAGAAHPYTYSETYCFMLEPLVRIDSLEQIFKDPAKALQNLQHVVRKQLLEKIIINGDHMVQLPKEEVIEGTKGWADFKCFAFDGEGIRLLFPPYQVAAYCFGPQVEKIDYKEIIREVRPVYVSALGIERFLLDAE
jgi:hypothetical protein